MIYYITAKVINETPSGVSPKKGAVFCTSGLYKIINGIILALAGMALSFTVQILEVAQYAIRMASETENHMTSVERVMTYASIEPEPGYSSETLPPEQWPNEGGLTLRNLSLKYLKDAPNVLNNISFNVAPKEKVGVVGRTGAGKSSLVAALFRMPEPEGLVRIFNPFLSIHSFIHKLHD